jgi:catechol 2,3-dioxygenase-like lactoylglutathione lyase family enzyme
MRITMTSVLVDDQDKALAFYTEVLGFRKKTDVPLGEHRWLTVVSPDALDSVELVLEPDEHPLPNRSRPRSSRTTSRSPLSASTTSNRSTSACVASVCTSRKSPRPWAR